MSEAIKLGEKEYSPEELNELVGYGNKYKEFSEKYDTDPEKAWKSYGRVTTENVELREKAKKLEQVESELAKIKEQKPAGQDGEYTQDQIREAKASLKKLDVVTKDEMSELLKGYGFIKAEDVDHKFATRELAEEFKNLGKAIDGKDGRPKFDQEEIIDYMEKHGLRDPEKAYKLKHEEQLSEWRAQKILEEKYPQIVTAKGGGRKEPPKVVVTKDNMKDLLREKLRKIEL